MIGPNDLTVGVVGGVGPEASNRFCELLLRSKPSLNDQENVRFIHFCNPQIPDRTEFILGLGEDPVPEIVRTCRSLERAGADFLIIACNTAHAFLERIRAQITAPLVDMVGLVTRQIKMDTPGITKVGILATTGSIRSRLFETYLARAGIAALVPSERDQEERVMTAIYGNEGIKAGEKELAKTLLVEAANRLRKLGAEAIILGCTEIPLVMDQSDIDTRLYDPMEVAAIQITEGMQLRQGKQEMLTSVTHPNFKDEQAGRTSFTGNGAAKCCQTY